VPNRREGWVKKIKSLSQFFSDTEYKIIHAHLSSLSDVSTLRVAKKNGVPIRIIHSHNTRQGGSRIHRYLHEFNKLTLNSYATNLFACSKAAAKWMFPSRTYNLNEYSIINNGIDVQKFLFDEHTRALTRKKLGIESRFVIGHIGRFHPQKNHDFLVDIF